MQSILKLQRNSLLVAYPAVVFGNLLQTKRLFSNLNIDPLVPNKKPNKQTKKKPRTPTTTAATTNTQTKTLSHSLVTLLH